MLHYNLACYWSLAGNTARALDELGECLELDPKLRSIIADEPDFQKLEAIPTSIACVVDPAALK